MMRVALLLSAVVSIALLAPLASAAAPALAYTAAGMAPPNGLAIALADFRGDGSLQMIVMANDGSARVLEASTGRLLATLTPGNAGCTSSCYSFEGVPGPINAPAIADVDHTGKLSIVLADTAAVVARYQFDPAHSSHDSFAFVKTWERRFSDFGATTMDAAPVLADLNGDGALDTVVVTEENGVFAVRPDGSLLWAQNRPGGHATPSVRDLDGDGKPEVVVARDDGVVDALAGATGAVKWSLKLPNVLPGSVPAAPLLSDINGDGKPDVVVTARDAHDSTNFANDHFHMFAIDSFGRVLWVFAPRWGAPMSHTRSVLVSVNGGRAILAEDWNTIGHKPGNFERVGPGHVFLVDAAGHEKWHQDLNAQTQSNKDLVVADVIGTGTQQALAEGTRNGVEGLLAFDLATGAYDGMLSTGAWSLTHGGPAAGNLFGDGRLAVAAPVQQGGSGAVMVWHGTSTLNAMFPGWAIAPPKGSPGALGGGGSGSGSGGGGGTTTNGSLSAAFAPKGNEWWVETGVKASESISGVSVSFNGAAGVALPATSWGTWAKSLHAPSGTVAQFTATGADGATATSGCYQWTGATPVACSGAAPPPPSPSPPPPPPASSSFNVTWRPSANGNEWWVETYATSSTPITGVEASVNGGSWSALTHESWGSWAASLHAPTGSSVTFRAHDAAGDIATSPAYMWPLR